MSKSFLIMSGDDQFGPSPFGFYGSIAGACQSRTTVERVECGIRDACTFTYMDARISANLDENGTTITLQKSQVDTALTVSVPALSTGNFSDTENVSFAATDEANWFIDGPTGTKRITIAHIGCELTPDVSSDTLTKMILQTNSDVSLSGDSISRYGLPNGDFGSSFSTVEADVKWRARASFLARDLRTHVTTNTRTTDTTFESRKNGSTGGQSVTIPGSGSGTFEDASGSDSLSAGDDFNYAAVTGTGTGSTIFSRAECSLLSGSNKFAVMAGKDDPEAIPIATTALFEVAGSARLAGLSLADVQYAPRFECRLEELTALVTINSITASASDVTLQVQGVDGNQALSIPAETTGLFSDSSNSDELDGNLDTISYAVTTPNTSGVARIAWIGCIGVAIASILIGPSAAVANAEAVAPTIVSGVQTIQPDPAIAFALAEDPTIDLFEPVIPTAAISNALAVSPIISISEPPSGSPPTGGSLTIDLLPDPAIAAAAAIAPTTVQSVIAFTPDSAIATALAINPTVLSGLSFDVANRATLVKQLLYRVEIEGYSNVLTNYVSGGDLPYIQEIEPFRKSINDLEGNVTMGDLVVAIVDKNRSITADFPGFLFEGKALTLKVGLEGLAETDFEILFQGFIDRMEGGENNLTWRIIAKDRGLLLRQTIYETGDDGNQISTEHPRILEGHPLDLLIAIFWQECALPESYIDWAIIQKYRDQLLAGMRFSFRLTAAVEAKQFIEQELLRPLGGWLHWTRKGVATIRFFFPIPGETDSVHTLTANNVVGIPVPEQAELINVLQHRYDSDTDTPHQTVSKDDDSIALYGLESLQTIESQGMRAALGGASISRIVGAMLFERYGGKPKLITALCFFDAILVETGDFVLLTHPHIPDRATGTLGVTNQKMEVLERTWHFMEGRVELVLLDATGLCAQYYIAPDDTPSYVPASAEEKVRYMFIVDDATGKYGNGDPAHQLG